MPPLTNYSFSETLEKVSFSQKISLLKSIMWKYIYGLFFIVGGWKSYSVVGHIFWLLREFVLVAPLLTDPPPTSSNTLYFSFLFSSFFCSYFLETFFLCYLFLVFKFFVCETWYLTCDTWHVVWGEHSLKFYVCCRMSFRGNSRE